MNTIEEKFNEVDVFEEIFDREKVNSEWDEAHTGREMPIAYVWSWLFDFMMF